MRTLLLMRHGKSDRDADYGDDHERPLNERGIASARAMGAELSRRRLAPDLVISSTAVRASSTAHIAREAGGWVAEVVLDPTLYGGDVADILGVAASRSGPARLMLVGHQPTWSQLLETLTGEHHDLKTADVAVVETDEEGWSRGRLAELIRSRPLLDAEASP